MYLFKKTIKKFLSNLDLKVMVKSKNQSNFDILIKLINKYKIDLVLDVGANEGQFAKKIREHGYIKKIISFEPLSCAYDKLIKNSKNDDNWKIFRRCAIGNENTKSQINISNYSLSSSLLEFDNAHLKARPDIAMINSEAVDIIRLDSLFDELNFKDNKILLKMDTQGYESHIIDGSKKMLQQCKIVFSELSLHNLYKQQKTWIDIIEKLKQSEFKLASIENGFFNPSNNLLLQVDAIFIKE